MKDLAAELAELRGLMAKGREAAARHGHATRSRHAAGAEGEPAEDVLASITPETLEELVASLRAVLEQPVEDLEEAIASHPLGSAAAAFFLGVLVGRILPRG